MAVNFCVECGAPRASSPACPLCGTAYITAPLPALIASTSSNRRIAMLGCHQALRALLLLLFASLSAIHCTADAQAPLRARVVDGVAKFKILQLADLHFTGDATFPCLNAPAQLATPCTEALMSAFVDELLEAEKPDFVVFSGDNVETFDEKHHQSAVDAFTKGVEQRGVPFAVILGNHDDENGFPREDVLRLTMAKTMSRSQRGPAAVDGVGNYELSVLAPVRGPWGSADDAVFRMYFLDSGGYPDRRTYPDVQSLYDWIKPSQVAYYRNLSAANYDQQQRAEGAKNAPLPAVMFFHIPLKEFAFAAADAPSVVGEKHEPVSSSTVDSELFSALVERGEVKAVFVGHDHINEYCFKRGGVQLCYGGGAGLGVAYGDAAFARRARVIEWTADATGRTIKSWKRQFGRTDSTCCHETLAQTPLAAAPAVGVKNGGAEGSSPLAAVHAGLVVTIVAATEDGVVVGFDVRMAGAAPLFRFDAHTGAVSAVSFSAHIPGLFATAGVDKTVKIWDLADNKPGELFSMSFYRDAPFMLDVVQERSWSEAADHPASVHQFPSSAPSSSTSASNPYGLTVDTSVMKDPQHRQWNAASPIDTGNNSDSPPGSARASASATPTSTHSEDTERFLRRRRSNSECLMLAKNQGGQNLPGPCKEYIAGVKQILARSEETPALLRRRSSMSLKSPPLMSK
ncbi:hypothetical protein PybrP1_011919 [[Pythium] brassicae (nom. inval.)]|nr:hypothetical protein PybrP1_011919 [[Pythium] brassicae (nom. inval.)]